MTFTEKLAEMRKRIAFFKGKEDYETVKTIGLIEALVNRSECIMRGTDCYFDRKPYVTEPIKMLEQAGKYLTLLEEGQWPLKGMYCEPGGAVIDHTFVQKDGEIHVFYNRGFAGYTWPEKKGFVNSLGHAVSRDLITWTPQAPVLYHNDDVEAPDNFQIWSPGIVKKDDLYYMFYTGVNHNIAQSTCLATSDNLVSWKRYAHNPVQLPGEWCRWDKGKWSNCRDGMVFFDGDSETYYIYYCTSIKGDGVETNAMGIASSQDLYHWTDENVFNVANCSNPPESPYVLKRNGQYYMFYTNTVNTFQPCAYYLVSDDPVKGWRVPEDSFVKENATAAEIFEFNGKWYMSYIYREINEIYLLCFCEFFWHEDGHFHLGERVK